MAAKERTKENCRCFDAADPRLRGCTPLRTPKRRSEVSAAKRTQYYCPFLTPSALPPLLSREFPRTPAGGRWRPPCQRGAGRVSGLGDSDGLCVAAHSRATSAREKGPGCRPPLPLSSTSRLRQSVGAGHARPSTSPLPPRILCIVGRGLDRLTAHNGRRQPAKPPPYNTKQGKVLPCPVRIYCAYYNRVGTGYGSQPYSIPTRT